eukprot:Gregarina_sp_Pseudo_9__4896@NODE_511_length_2668_cov_102_885127_g482_i0_p1_GENE_NODE_511_length_2668_cov_102_885127_g482_i0NODE_511_length_2668_cov_102_885127_g482_i0_p1_ORF_typecomplete_len336_score6_52CcmD/PF04995_14/1_3e02CcmD/PF04995_14/2_4_NODE_511_length_2668_cov_102_885127_g482_i015932600
MVANFPKSVLRCGFWSSYGFFILIKYKVHMAIRPVALMYSSPNGLPSQLFCICFLSFVGLLVWSCSQNRRFHLSSRDHPPQTGLFLPQTKSKLPSAESPEMSCLLPTPSLDDDRLSDTSTCAQTPTNLSVVLSSNDDEEYSDFVELKRNRTPVPAIYFPSCQPESSWNFQSRQPQRDTAHTIITMKLLSKHPWLACTLASVLISTMLTQICLLHVYYNWIDSGLLAATTFVTMSNAWEILKLLWFCVWDPELLSTRLRSTRLVLCSALLLVSFGTVTCCVLLSRFWHEAARVLMMFPLIYATAAYLCITSIMFVCAQWGDGSKFCITGARKSGTD